MQEIKLKAQKRDLQGRKVKKLRTEGLVPANVYGKKVKSQAISLKKEEFEKIYSQAGETGVVNLLIEGEKEERPVLLQNVQLHPLTDEPLHVDLRQIILTEKVTAMIPVEQEGESPAVAQKLGILIQPVSEIEVEALPMDLPERFVVDVSKLENVGDEIKVSQLSVDKKITLLNEEDLVIVKIDPLAAEEVVLPPVAEGADEEEKATKEDSGEEEGTVKEEKSSDEEQTQETKEEKE